MLTFEQKKLLQACEVTALQELLVPFHRCMDDNRPMIVIDISEVHLFDSRL